MRRIPRCVQLSGSQPVRDRPGCLRDVSEFGSDRIDVDIIAVLKALLAENRRCTATDQLVFRPDHGHRMLDDLAKTKRANPGYTAIGRLRGLAELRGAIRAIAHADRA